jgi:hypothetical protein
MARPATAQDIYIPGAAGKDKAPKKDTKLREEGPALFGGKPADPAAATPADVWSIVIHGYRDDDQDSAATADLERVRTEGRLPEAYLEHRGDATVIAYGRYTGPTTKEAQGDLKRIQNLEITLPDGRKGKPFAGAFIAPPMEIRGSIPEYDLRNVRKLNGEWVLYTLQIGVYGRADKKAATPAEMEEFRQTAEKAVTQLRREGEQAFYFHGPRMSSVTVGLFGKDDFDPALKIESAALRVMRQRFPYNLQNGLGIRQRLTATNPQTGKSIKIEQLQKSALMNVPE